MRKWFRGFLTSTLIVLLTACGGGSNGGSVTTDTDTPVTTLNDNEEITLNAGDTYTEEGTTETAIVDTTAPVITLNGNAVITLNVGDNYIEEGATGTDNVDDTVTVTITGSVDTTAAGIYTITYTATDSTGNESTQTRTVTVSAVVVPDTTAPVITLNGNAVITLNVGDTYIEEGATGTDNVDDTVTVTITGSIDTTTAGIYTITYTATDSAGNTSTKIRTVTMVPVSSLKKTGQTISYSPMDDGDYQKGITPSYSRDDANEVVTDNVTGLMWQDDAEAESVEKPWVTQDNYADRKYYDTSGDTATTYCANLTLGGYSDWRVPTVEELGGLVYYGDINPAINSVFEHTASRSYWASGVYNGSQNHARLVSFSSGLDYWNIKPEDYYVRCVR